MLHFIDTVKLVVNFQKKNLNTTKISEELIQLNNPNVLIRRYAPLRLTKKTELSPIFLPHGLNHHGYNDARMIHLARALSASGYTVYSPHLASIIRYDIDFKSARQELETSLHYIFEEKPHAQVKIICFSLIASLTLYVTSLHNITPRINSLFMLSAYHDVDAFIDYVLIDPAASQFAKFILLKNLFNHQYGLNKKLDEQFLQVISQLQAQSKGLYQGDFQEFPAEEREAIKNVIQTKNIDEVQYHFAKGLEDLKNACRLDIKFEQKTPKINIVHSKEDKIIPSSEAYKLAAAFKNQTTINTLVTPIFDHADIKINMNTIKEFLKLCTMFNFL